MSWALDRFVPRHLSQMVLAVVLGCFVSGLVWTGAESVDMGLVDHLGSAGYVAREVIGEEDIVDFTREPDLLEQLTERIGVAMARALNRLVLEDGGQVR